MSNLPSGFTQLEYLEGTGTQYIDTGYSAPNGFYCEVDFEYTSFGNSGGRYIIGSHNTVAPYERNGLGAAGGYFAMGLGDISPTTNFAIALNTRYKLHYSTVRGDSYLEVNGTRVFTSGNADERSSFNLLVLMNHYSVMNGSDATFGKLYSAKIYDPENELVRDFVPARRNADDELGLYDTVGGTFYTNIGAGTFVAGPEVIAPVEPVNPINPNSLVPGYLAGCGLRNSRGKGGTA